MDFSTEIDTQFPGRAAIDKKPSEDALTSGLYFPPG